MLAGCFKLVPDEPKPQQPGAEGVFLIFRLRLDSGRSPLHKRLMGNGKAQLDICLDLSGVKGGVKHTEFNRAFGEHAVQIEGMVAADVIMMIAAAPSVVPKFFYFLHRPRTLMVEFF